jgi:hypothetical protein
MMQSVERSIFFLLKIKYFCRTMETTLDRVIISTMFNEVNDFKRYQTILRVKFCDDFFVIDLIDFFWWM